MKKTMKLSILSKRIVFINLLSLTVMFIVVSMNSFAHGDDDHGEDTKNKKKTSEISNLQAQFTTTAPQRLSDGSLFIPKSVQRQLGIRTQIASTTKLAASVELNGKIIADPDTGGRVQATFAGTLHAPEKGMPSLGRKVTKGEVLAYLKPIDSAIERGNQKANLADIESQLEIVSRKLARYEQLASVVPVREIETTRLERDSLIRRQQFVNASLNASEPLRASATGTISASYVVAGQVVDAKEVLFEIVDTSRLAVEALAYDAQIGSQISSANAMSNNSNQLIALHHIGTGQQLRDQALPLLFRIKNTQSKSDGQLINSLAVGQTVKVIVRTKADIQGSAVLRSALIKGKSGENMVWVHKEAERFVPLRITHSILDAQTIAITQGLHDGDRVVTMGATLLSEVR